MDWKRKSYQELGPVEGFVGGHKAHRSRRYLRYLCYTVDAEVAIDGGEHSMYKHRGPIS